MISAVLGQRELWRRGADQVILAAMLGYARMQRVLRY